MKPKTALFIVLTIVITGEAISDFIAKNHSFFTAIAIAAFSGLLVRSIVLSSKRRKEGGPFL